MPTIVGFFCFRLILIFKNDIDILNSEILSDKKIFIDMGNLNKKIVVRLTKRQLEYLLEETIKENITISQLVRKALTEHLIKRG